MPEWVRTERDLERGHAARDRLLRLRRRSDAALHRQPRHDPAAHLGQPGGQPREARLVRARPRPEGGAVRRRGEGRAGDPRPLRRASTSPASSRPAARPDCTCCIPLGRQCTYEQSRTLGELLARVVVAELPEIATITRQVSRRGGKVYVDYVQNGHGRLLVAPFSVAAAARARRSRRRSSGAK